MDKRTFIKTSSALVAGGLLAPLASCNSSETKSESMRTNWAGNLTYGTSKLYSPASVEEAQEIIRHAKKIRVLGSRHCFNRIADSDAAQLSLQRLNQIEINEEAKTVTVGAGVRYGDLCPVLYKKGYALHNLASLPHISVAGACATATHGSGVNNGNLATAASGIEFINGRGEIVNLTRAMGGERFPGAVVGLGSLGAVTKTTLNLLPSFDMRQDVYQFLPQAELENHFDEIMSGGYSVSLFTDWQSDTVNQVWIKNKVHEGAIFDSSPEYFGAKRADKNLHPILSLSAENCTEQMGVPGPWYERMPHFKMNFTPSSGKELQAEYFVPRNRAMEAFHVIRRFKDQLAPLLMISEIRAIAGDDLWMSMAYHRASVAFHFTFEQNTEAVMEFLPTLESALEPIEVRPHWGKVFTIAPEKLQSGYERLAEFKRLVALQDPEGKFRNDFMERNLFGS
jgi:alditol oxidase